MWIDEWAKLVCDINFENMRKFAGCHLFLTCSLLVFSSCSLQKQIAKQAGNEILNHPDFASAHIGISLYDPVTGRYLYDHQGDKLFVPASNTKIFTCYASMKNLGDSLVALRYVDKGNGIIEVEPNADPSFLHPDFSYQPVLDLFRAKSRVLLTDENWRDNALGFGWAWDDYNSDYMAERSAMPVYGNVVRFTQSGRVTAYPVYFQKAIDEALVNAPPNFSIRRELAANRYTTRSSGARFATVDIPIFTRENQVLLRVLNDTLKGKVEPTHVKIDRLPDVVKVYSQPTDSLLKIMMHRSDNFFAEQLLLMVSNDKLGYMNDARIIDTLLKTDFSGLPQKPRWVDGSGLSRYNLISPRDFIWVLTQMKNEFKWERIQAILPTGGDGTLGSYYKNYAGLIYAKTGSLSNHLALSGFITTRKGKQWIFSVLVNAELAPAANIRKGVERFLTSLIERN